MSYAHHQECRCQQCQATLQGGHYAGLGGSCQCGSCAARYILHAQAAANAGPVAGKVRDGSLTFAEAMALDPSEVEYHAGIEGNSDRWLSVADNQGRYPLSAFRDAKFRRSRPKRSRVEEMADGKATKGCVDCGYDIMLASAYKEAILAVCEFVAGKYDADVDYDIRREFLEKRSP